MSRRSVILGIALLATLAASWWAVLVEDDTVPMSPVSAPPSATARSDATPDVGAGVDFLRGARPAWPAWAGGILTPMSFAPPPPPPTPVAMITPSPPPLPFRYVGEIEESGERAVILLEGEDVHIVRARQRIGEHYRVERISTTEIELTYLPLMQRQLIGTSTYEQYQ